MKILCIDDEATSLKLYRKCSEGLPLDDAVFMDNGKEAIDLINQTRFDLIVTDMMMPGSSGIDVMKAAKARDPLVDIIMVTGHASYENAIEAMRLGARDYLQKPINIQLLTEKINNIREIRNRVKAADELRIANVTLEEELGSTNRELEDHLIKTRRILKTIETVITSQDDSDAELIRKIKDVIRKE